METFLRSIILCAFFGDRDEFCDENIILIYKTNIGQYTFN